MTPPSEAEPGPEALGAIAAVTGPAAPPKPAPGSASPARADAAAGASASSQPAKPARATGAEPTADPTKVVPLPSASLPGAAAAGESGGAPARSSQAEAFAPSPAALGEGMSVATREMMELNTKLLHMLRSQSEAAFELWRSTVSAPSVSEAIRLQTSGLRKAYETSSAQWKDIAEATSRLLQSTMPKK